MLRRLDGASSVVSKIAAVLAACCGMVIVVVLTAEVYSRSVRGTSIAGSYELSELLLVSLVFLGLAHAERTGAHVRSSIVTARLPKHVARVVRSAGCLVGAAIAGWMAAASTERLMHSVEIREFRQGLIQFPIWPARIMVAVGLWLLVVEMVMSAARHLHAPPEDEPVHPEVQAAEEAGVS